MSTIALRPSRSPPSLMIRPLSAVSDTSIADALGLDGRHVVHVPLFERVARRVVVFPAGELAESRAATDLRLRGSITSLIDHSGYMMPAMIFRDSTGFRQTARCAHARACCSRAARGSRREKSRTAARRRAPLPSAPRSALRIFARRIGADARVLAHVDQLERLDRLRLPVFCDFKVFLLADRGQDCPARSLTMTSTRTKLMSVRKTGVGSVGGAAGGAGWLRPACPARSPRARAAPQARRPAHSRRGEDAPWS